MRNSTPLLLASVLLFAGCEQATHSADFDTRRTRALDIYDQQARRVDEQQATADKQQAKMDKQQAKTDKQQAKMDSPSGEVGRAGTQIRRDLGRDGEAARTQEVSASPRVQSGGANRKR